MSFLCRCRCACMVSLLLAVAMAPAATARLAPSPHAPPLVVTTLDGKSFNLAAEHGRWVIVNFWATWCSPCLAEMPAISRYVAAHKNVTAIGLAYQPEPVAEVVKFARQHRVDYPLAYVGERVPEGFQVETLPTTYLVAPDGDIAKHFIGPVNAQLLDAAITAARGH